MSANGIYWHNGKPLFVGGKIAFAKACCCDLACFRRVFLVFIAGEGPFSGSKPANPPMRPSAFGTSNIMYHAETIDTIAPGFYHNIVWTIEFCYNNFDIDPSDDLDPVTSYYNALNLWACNAQMAWMGATECFVEVSYVDDPYAAASYTTIEDSTRLNMDSLVGPGNWSRTNYFGPVLTTHCPLCSCDFSCIPDGT
tara:strand:+ start:2491 stop:3078 length:588 start_codon:yes stop_codon:yes gene_type:complete